ncbi:MAG: PAS domain S-box protein [Bacteroidales bacterium]
MRNDRNTEERIQTNRRRLILSSLLVLVLTLLVHVALLMDRGESLRISTLLGLPGSHPTLFVLDLMPLLVFALLLGQHRQLIRTWKSQEARLRSSDERMEQNAAFAKILSEGEDPEPYEGMLENNLGKALRMIQINIKSNRRKEREQSWIAEGKDIVSKILREHQDPGELSYQILRALNTYIDAIQGAFYLHQEDTGVLVNTATYAFNRRKYVRQEFRMGEGLVGQCAYEMDYIYRTEIPADYVTIRSGILGDQKPASILLVPLITNEELQGIVEFAFLENRIPKLTIQFLLELGEIIARTLMNLRMNLKTRRLLEESRTMTGELRNNEILLQENAKRMKSTQLELEQSNLKLETQMQEAQNAQNRLHLLLEFASEVISIYDDQYRLTYISPSVIHIFGYTAAEMMGGKDMDRISREDEIRIRKTLEQLRKDPLDVKQIEYSYLKKNGERIFLRTLCRNKLADPSIRGLVLNTTDITESIRVEKEQRLKTRMQSLSENSLDLILRLNRSGLIHYANPIVEDYTGMAPESILNRNLSEIDFPESFSRLLVDILHAVETHPVKKNLQVTLPIRMGEYLAERILSVDAIPEFQGKELETVLVVGHDITEAKRIEKEIKIQNRKVQDSINYAERIQSSILPEMDRIGKAFAKSFVYYQPRDVISGDFPWMFESKDAWYLAAVDCTGHGVPGALLSLVGLFLLNNITALNPGLSAGELAENLHKEVRKALKQDRDGPETRDGMDMALCKFFKKENRMEFAGAHRPLYLLSEGELTVLPGDNKAIGGIPPRKKEEKPFTTHSLACRKGDKFFFFTDGFIDQLGGPKGLKYGSARFRNALLDHAAYTLPQFHSYFQKDHIDWRGDEAQLDDLLLIGIEV